MSETWNEEFMAARQRILTSARFILRVKGFRGEALADKLQIAEELAYRDYLRLKERHEPVADKFASLGRYAGLQAACGRTIEGCEPKREAMRLCETGGEEEVQQAVEALIDKRTDPAVEAEMRLDLPLWLDRLPAKKRLIVEDIMQGEETPSLVKKHKVTPARISQIRREAAEDWQEFRELVPSR